MNDLELAVVRRAFAKQIMCPFELKDRRIEDAFASLRREDFLGPGPWKIYRTLPFGRMSPAFRYLPTPDDDPVYVYQDVLIGILPDRALNNGQPSFLAFLISLGGIQPGQHVVHIGAGVGYYTAVIAHLAEPDGRVTAIEFEPELAERAEQNLGGYPSVQVIAGDGTKLDFDSADVIFVNAGTTHPADHWLDRLNDGGRLILPLTTSFTTSDGHLMSQGAIFLIQRRGDDFAAHWKSATAIYPCAGARDEASEHALQAAFKKGGWERVTRLYRSGDIPDENCWLRAANCSMAYH